MDTFEDKVCYFNSRWSEFIAYFVSVVSDEKRKNVVLMEQINSLNSVNSALQSQVDVLQQRIISQYNTCNANDKKSKKRCR